LPKDRSPRRRPEPISRFQAPRRPGVLSRLRWLLTVVPILFVAAGTYYVLNSPWLTVQQVHIQGTESLDQASLIEISGLQGRSMFGLPVKGAQARLMAVPQVKSVSIERNWPDAVTITIEERKPAAFWSVGGQDYVVSAGGYVLGGGAPDGPAPRIVEVGNDRTLNVGDRVHPDAIALAQRIFKESPRFLGEDVESLEYQADVGVTAVFHGGMRVTFGDERSYEYKVAVLAKLLDQLSVQGKTPKMVDLRFGERVTYE
jgi:cell division septal protein FtsQ